MRYAYKDLGEQPAGATAIVHWHGSAADVLLLDPVSFSKYRASRSAVFYSAGGRYGRSPARLSIPEDGHWFVVADFRGPAADATVEVLKPDAENGNASDEESLVGVG
jgi:Domain of unknown function (DUF1883)